MKPSKSVAEILDFITEHNVEIVSYGLAPNPNGFCYELPDDLVDTDVDETLSRLFNGLTREQERELKGLVF
jgi:hypothetical protein